VLEVVPNLWARLCGAEETLSRVREGFFLPVDCVICGRSDLCCVEDADYLICPSCRAVTPVLNAPAQNGRTAQRGVPVAGLGLPLALVPEWLRYLRHGRRRRLETQRADII